MTPRPARERLEEAHELDPEELEPIADVVESLSASTPSSLGDRRHRRLHERFAALVPAPQWRPRSPLLTAMTFAVIGLLLLCLAALSLAGAGPLAY